MQQAIEKLMAEVGVIRLENESLISDIRPSRGYYIVIPGSGVWYLHHDGEVKNGVIAEGKKPAFWETEESANEFFERWKDGRTAK